MPTINQITREDDGTLPAYAWPGAYNIVYYDSDGDTLCAKCANKLEEEHKEYRRVRNEVAKVRNELDQAKDRVDRSKSALEVIDGDFFRAEIMDLDWVISKIEFIETGLTTDYLYTQITGDRKLEAYELVCDIENDDYDITCADCLTVVVEAREDDDY